MPWYWPTQRTSDPPPSLPSSNTPMSSSAHHQDAKSALQAILASSTTPSSDSSRTTTLIPASSNNSTPMSSPKIPAKEIYQLDRQTKGLQKQGDESKRMLMSTTEALKEFGDLQTWAEVVWREIYVLDEVFAVIDSGVDPEEATMRIREELEQ